MGVSVCVRCASRKGYDFVLYHFVRIFVAEPIGNNEGEP
jgi:hypothetical protein